MSWLALLEQKEQHQGDAEHQDFENGYGKPWVPLHDLSLRIQNGPRPLSRCSITTTLRAVPSLSLGRDREVLTPPVLLMSREPLRLELLDDDLADSIHSHKRPYGEA